jgi:hypothetical protein
MLVVNVKLRLALINLCHNASLTLTTEHVVLKVKERGSCPCSISYNGAS